MKPISYEAPRIGTRRIADAMETGAADSARRTGFGHTLQMRRDAAEATRNGGETSPSCRFC
jgi:hypothetical protein